MPDLDIGGEIVWINQVDPLPEVWIYFLSLEFWPGAEIGTLYSVFGDQYYPQDVVLPFDPTSKF